MRSQRLAKYGELPTSTCDLLRVATIFKATSRELLRHLSSLLRRSYEYLRVSMGRELGRYGIQIAALSETWFADVGEIKDTPLLKWTQK